jgi:RNA polymerase sigma-70 factor (ECF subfamily)
LNELRLIRQVQRHGSRAAADTLVRRYYDEIYAYLQKQLASPQTAQDITQETFISMLRTINTYDPRRASFRTWLYRIATNKAIDHYRSRTYHQQQHTVPLEKCGPLAEQDFTRRFADEDFARRVCDYVGGLPASTQQVFRLHIFAGHTFAQIAQMLSIPEGSVKTTYYRLLERLRKEFAADE